MSEALHHMVICTDIEHSGSIGDGARPAVREGLHAVVVSALAGIGVGPQLYYKEDRGDGVLILAHPSVPKERLLGRWLVDLNEQLRESNRERARPIRLRVGMNAGEVRRDAEGVSGDAVDLTFRLTNSDAARNALAGAPDATLVVIVSERLFADAVAVGGQYIESVNYHRVRVTAKSVDTDAWIYIPRLGVPSVPVGGIGTGGTRAEQAETHGRSDERRVINAEIYNENAFGSVKAKFANFGVVKDSRIGGADDE